MKRVLVVALAFLCSLGAVKADEGMWLPMFIKRLNYVDMQREGLKLTPEEIYSVNNSSLKDAILNFGGFCTGEVISSQGLVLTNHHCGYDAIAELSSPEHDYLNKGYWAADQKGELKPRSLYVSFLVSMEDVTDKVQAGLNSNMSEQERAEAVEQLIAKIEEEAENGNSYRASVKSFFKGNEFYLFLYNDYKDVRFVGAPPASVGKYGGDTDNWMWPRHTGDFSLFRIYADKDGNPADYSENNVPLQPKNHLTIDMGGVKEGDFSMIMGYPGSTERYLPSWGIEQAIKVEYPAVVDVLGKKLAVMKQFMNADKATELNYASSYASLANYWKNRIGMIEALGKNRTADKKRLLEADFAKWVATSEEHKSKYGKALSLFENYYKELGKVNEAYMQLRLGLMLQDMSNLVKQMSSSTLPKYIELKKADRKEEAEKIRESLSGFAKSHNLNLEKALLLTQLENYDKKTAAAFKSAFISELSQEYDADWGAYVEDIWNESLFTNEEALEKFLKSPKEKKLLKDPFILLNKALNEQLKVLGDTRKELAPNATEAYRLFVDGLRKMNPGKAYYPDANFTMRLTYGKVLSYDARDALHYKYFTTLKGVIEKYKPNDLEFDLPSKLVDLYQKKDFGKYADAEGYLPVNFLTNHDITGGNSGSPVLNEKGQLIGTAFDGNWEAMSGDIEFEPNLQRTIVCDIRYVLFIIDKLGGAPHLVQEMDLVF